MGSPIEHDTGGLLSFYPTIFVPWAGIYSTIFVQMAVWDGTVWGTSIAGAPTDQLGYTDTVPVFLTSPTGNTRFSEFTQPAVVPVVPEPSTFLLVGIGGLCLLLFRRRN